MKRTFWVLFVLVLLTPPSGAAPANPTRDLDRVVVVTATTLNVRTGPGTSHAIARLVHAGTVLPVLGQDETGDWLNVQTSDGIIGWVSAEYVAVQPSRVVDTRATPTPLATTRATEVTPPTVAADQLATDRLQLLWASLPYSDAAKMQFLYLGVAPTGFLLIGAARAARRRRQLQTAVGGASSPGHAIAYPSKTHTGPPVHGYSGDDRGWDTSVDPDPRRTERYEREWKEREEREQAAQEERWAAREEEQQAWNDALAEQAEEQRAAQIQAISDYQAERALEQWDYEQEKAQERWDYEMEKRQERWERQFRDDE